MKYEIMEKSALIISAKYQPIMAKWLWLTHLWLKHESERRMRIEMAKRRKSMKIASIMKYQRNAAKWHRKYSWQYENRRK
jgi:hypothetical protein